MRKVWMVSAAMGLVVLGGCAIAPVGPQNRADWKALHSREYQDVTVEQALDSAQKVLTLADHDFVFDFPQNKLTANRAWSIYMVLAAAFGTDYWDIAAVPTDGGVELTVQISRQAGSVLPTPTVGVTGAAQGTMGVGAGYSTMPGTNIAAPFPYNLFWARLDYMLGKSTSWPTCKQAEAGKTGREKMGSDVLCSVTTDDKLPEM